MWGLKNHSMGRFFHLILNQPLLNLLILFYNYIPGRDMGIAIIALTVLIRLVLYPSFSKSLRAQKQMQQLQPKLEEIRAKHKDDKEAQSRAIMEFYKANKVNPFGSCLPLVLQLIILIPLYQVFLSGLKGGVGGELYKFVADPGQINTMFLGLIDLTKANYVFAVIAGLSQFFQSKLMMPKNKTASADKTAAIMNMQFTYVMPAVTVLVALQLPAGLSLYWIVTTLFAIAQQWYIMKSDGRETGNN